MRSRRLILTLECVTTYTLAEIRAALTHVALSHGRWITRYPDNEDGMPNRIVQVQANAIRPTPSGLPSPHWRRITSDVKRKAKRAKGAK